MGRMNSIVFAVLDNGMLSVMQQFAETSPGASVVIECMAQWGPEMSSRSRGLFAIRESVHSGVFVSQIHWLLPSRQATMKPPVAGCNPDQPIALETPLRPGLWC